MRKKSKKLLRLDSSPPQFLKDHTDRQTDKQQIELAIQIGEHSYMSRKYLQTKIKCSMKKKVKNSDAKLLRLDSSPPQFLNGQIYGQTEKNKLK